VGISISLTAVANKFFLYDTTGAGPTLKYGGADVVAGEFGAWTPIAAVRTATGYDVAWKIAGADAYTAWSTDSNGNYITAIIGYGVPGTDPSLEVLETTFQQDLNGDGKIGPAAQVIPVDGSTSLTSGREQILSLRYYRDWPHAQIRGRRCCRGRVRHLDADRRRADGDGI